MEQVRIVKASYAPNYQAEIFIPRRSGDSLTIQNKAFCGTVFGLDGNIVGQRRQGKSWNFRHGTRNLSVTQSANTRVIGLRFVPPLKAIPVGHMPNFK